MQTGKIKPGYKNCSTQIIFYNKIYGKFTRKARFLVNGYKIYAPDSIIYSSVISRFIVRIDCIIDLLDDLDMFICNIRNVNLTAKCSEKLWVVTGKYFGPLDRGSVIIIDKALYGL